MKYTYHWSYSEYLAFLIIFSQRTSRNLHLPLSLRTSKEFQIKTLPFLVAPTQTVFVFHSFGGAKNMPEKENLSYKSRFSEYFHSFQFFKVNVLKGQLLINNQRLWRRKKPFNHLLVKCMLHEKREGEG